MNYYRRYIADYGSKTGANSMIEDGAYTRLLDWYYEHEKPLPLEQARIFQIARAIAPIERKAALHVLTTFFDKRADGWHNARADEELAQALPKLDTLRRVARENGAKGGRPRRDTLLTKPNPVIAQEPKAVPEPEPDRHPDPEPSSQPLSLSEVLTTAFPVVEASRPEPRKAEAESKPDPHPRSETRTAGLAALLRKARVTDVDSAKGLMDRWLEIATDHDLLQAVNDACRSRGGQPFVAAYLDPIVERIVEQSRRTRAEAEAKVAKTQAQIEEQRHWPQPGAIPASATKYLPRKFPATEECP